MEEHEEIILLPNLGALSEKLKEGSDSKQLLDAFTSGSPVKINAALCKITDNWKLETKDEENAA